MRRFLPALAMILAAAAPAEHRLLYVFVPDTSAPLLARQRALLDDPVALAERDIVRIDVVGDTVEGATATATELRRRFEVERADSVVVLVGKDGGVKRRDTAPIPAASLFATIDAMPMRQDERRRR